jgi:hypothetical protein
MLSAELQARVKAATVRLPERKGQAVLVPGGVVLTATHCIGWDGSAGLTLGDHHPLAVETANGASFRLGPMFADAISDMAALGILDNQEFPRDEEAFEEWAATVVPLDICNWRPRAFRESLAVNILTHQDVWLRGRIVNYALPPRSAGRISLEIDDGRLEGGMSGGPVVDDNGAVLGVVSWGSERGAIPLAAAALPRWILRELNI